MSDFQTIMHYQRIQEKAKKWGGVKVRCTSHEGLVLVYAGEIHAFANLIEMEKFLDGMTTILKERQK